MLEYLWYGNRERLRITITVSPLESGAEKAYEDLFFHDVTFYPF